MAKEKNLTNVTSVAAADFVRVVTSAGASVKGTMENFAKSLLTTAFSGLSLGGSQQSVKNALDSLNSKRQTFWITAGSSLTIGSKNVRYMLTLHGGGSSYRGLYLVSGFASSIEMKAVSEVASGVITISGTNLTINNTSQYGIRVAVDMHEGNITV